MHRIPKLKCFSSRLAVVFAQFIEARCYVENEDVVGAAPTGDAPTTSEWSAILLPNEVQLILDVWRYFGTNYEMIQRFDVEQIIKWWDVLTCQL